MRHEVFIDVSGELPLEGFVEKLLQVIGSDGAVVMWSKGFEATRLRELATLFPQHADALLSIIERMIDLLPIYREHYYHRDIQGVWSIKAVLPKIAPALDDGDLAIADRDDAQEAFRRAIAPGISATERDAIAQQLMATCERDTLAITRLTRLPDHLRAPEHAAADGFHAAEVDQLVMPSLTTAHV